MKMLIIPVYLILTVAGLILMKLGGNPGTIALKSGTMEMSMSMISGIGFICYIGSFLLFTRMVVMFDLSYIFPLCTGIVQIVTLIASVVIFKEKLSIESIVGASLIIIGIILMNWKK